MLQISPSTYINPFLLDAVLSLGDGEDTLYTSTEGKLHREGPSPAQLASAGFLQFGSLFINKLRISRIITANDTLTTMSGYIFKLPGVNWASVAAQLSYKETRSYGYEVPGLQYVYTSTPPSNTSGLPPELTGEGGSSGAFEMQFLGLYPNDVTDTPSTAGYYISVGTNSYNGVTFYDGEAIIFVEGQNPLVIQDYGMRSQSLLGKFITSGSTILDLISSEPGSEGWYINYEYIGDIPPGKVIYVDSSLELSYFDPPVGLTAVLVKNQIAYRMVCNYIGGTDSTLLNAPTGWHSSLVATPTILDNTESSSISIYPSRSNMHIIQAGAGSLTLSFIAEGDVGFNSYMKGTIIVIGSDIDDTYIDFPDVSGNQPYPRGVGGSSNYIVFEYQYIAGEVHILQAVPRISNSIPTVFEKSTAALVGPDWWVTTELGPDISHITITNITNASGNLIIDFGNSLKHKPRELAFILSGNYMNGDLIIATSDGNVTFTAPLAGSVHKLFLGGPVGISSL